jgi:hypothetical protein
MDTKFNINISFSVRATISTNEGNEFLTLINIAYSEAISYSFCVCKRQQKEN